MRVCARAAITASMLLLPLLPAAARAQGFDVSGSWVISMQAVSRPPAGPGQAPAACNFQGTASDAQTGSQFSGNITVALVSGPGGCPSSMSASLSGNVTGNQITMGAVMGFGLGQASFTGTLTPAAPVKPGSTTTGTPRPPQPAAPVNPGSTITGPFSVTSGPFTGTSGTWSAVKQASAAPGIPALGASGLAILALLLLGAAVWLLKRRLATSDER
jgi:hypothetical protein